MISEPQKQAPEASQGYVFEWYKHLGLLTTLGATTLICLKLLAVAGWDSTTAFGILAANGTANVLTGTLLAVLPPLYAAFAFAIAPRIERYLAHRTDVERAAARMLETWPVTLLMFIVPTGLLLAYVGYVILIILLALIRRIRESRTIEKAQRGTSARNDAPSRFERISAGLGALMMLVFSSLSTPWLPPETILTASGEQTAYVLKSEGDTATVLLAKGRTLARIQTSALTGNYCSSTNGWWDEPVLRVFAGEKYPDCAG
jgi:hypothetical protein